MRNRYTVFTMGGKCSSRSVNIIFFPESYSSAAILNLCNTRTVIWGLNNIILSTFLIIFGVVLIYEGHDKMHCIICQIPPTPLTGIDINIYLPFDK